MTFLDRFVRALLLRHRHRGSTVSRDSRRDFLRTIIMAPVVLPAGWQVIERITLPSDPYSVRLLKAMAAGDMAAMEAFSAFISSPILQVIEQAPVISDLFKAEPFDASPYYAKPVIPLDIGAWDEPLLGGVTDIRSPGIVSEPHSTWCHGWPRRRGLS